MPEPPDAVCVQGTNLPMLSVCVQGKNLLMCVCVYRGQTSRCCLCVCVQGTNLPMLSVCVCAGDKPPYAVCVCVQGDKPGLLSGFAPCAPRPLHLPTHSHLSAEESRAQRLVEPDCKVTLLQTQRQEKRCDFFQNTQL